MQTTTTKRVASTYSSAIQQRIATSGAFDGTFPTGDCPVTAGGPQIYKFAEQAAGGLFFWDSSEAIICGQMHIEIGAAADIKLYLVNLDPATCHIGGSFTVLTGEKILIEFQAGANFLALDEARFKAVLLPYQALQLIVASPGAVKMQAQAVASLERTYIR